LEVGLGISHFGYAWRVVIALLICDIAQRAPKKFLGLNAANPLKSLVSEEKKKGNASKF
jgi:hypothetical protein